MGSNDAFLLLARQMLCIARERDHLALRLINYREMAALMSPV